MKNVASCFFELMSRSLQPNYGIARVELPQVGSVGWQVRLQRHGEKISRFFSDRSHGSTEQSLLAAREWRDTALQSWLNQDRARVCDLSRRNASGVVGVCRVVVRAANGNEYHFWQATWCPAPGIRRSVKFSIKKHGDDIAYQLAIEARRLGIE